MDLLLALLLNPGVPADTAQNQGTAQKLQRDGDFSEEKSGHGCRGHRLAELGGRNKRRGEEFQAPAENAVTQNCGEDGQKRANKDGAGAVAEQLMALDSAGQHKHCGTGGVDHVGVHRGGSPAPDHPADEGVHSHGDGRQQSQHIAVELGAAAGIGVSDETAAGQSHRDGGDGFDRELALQKWGINIPGMLSLEQ